MREPQAGTDRFALAPMSGLVRVLTWGMLALPLVLVGSGLSSDGGGGAVAGACGGLLAVAWCGVFLWMRPTGFEIDANGLRIVWPLRSATVSTVEIARVLSRDRSAFKAHYGGAIRIGVGGLFGAFGMLWTTRGGFVDVYLSRLDGWVVIERVEGRPLLITPQRPREFVQRLSAVAQSRS